MANAFNLGLDLGTSNTVCSYVTEDGKIENFKFSDSEQTPSIVYSKNNKTLIGYQARRKYELTRGQGLYRSYKMHTYIKDQAELERLNYTDMTPSEVMEKFLLTYVGKFMKEKNVEKVDQIVVGAPEIFFRSVHGADMRTELKKIVERCNITDRDHIRVVSEPAAAAAYYLHLSEMKKEKMGEEGGINDNAYILIIDAGGGTLDINLCRHVIKDGKRTIQIVARSGAGEHYEKADFGSEEHIQLEPDLDTKLNIHSKSYGRSGIFYLEEVLRAAVRNQYPGVTEVDEDNEFKKAFNELEDYIKNPPMEDEEEMRDYFREKKSGLDEDYLEEHANDGFTVEYQDEDLLITYNMMYDVYEKTFKLILEHELDVIREYTKNHSIDVPYDRADDGTAGDSIFRVVNVGGFSSFPLVRYQVERYFGKLPVNDPRFETVGVKEASLAVANGLALLANGDVEYSMRAPYGLSVSANVNEDSECTWVGVRYGEFLNPSKDMEEPFYVHWGDLDTKEERKNERTWFMGDTLEYMGYDNGSGAGVVIRKVSPKLKEQVEQIVKKHVTPEGNDPCFHVGFSFDESSQLYIHFVELNDAWKEKIGPLKFEDILDRKFVAVKKANVV